MDVALLLGLVEDLHGLVVGDVVAHAGLAAVVGKVAHADAPVLLDVAGALAPDALLLAAGADAHADVTLVLLQPVADVFHVHGLTVGGDGLLHGDDVHADAGAAGGHQMGDAGQGQVGHALKEVGHLGGHRRDLRPHDHDLGAAGHEHVQYPALLVVGVLAVQILKVPLHQAGLAQGLQHRGQVLVVIAAQLFELGEGLGLALAHLQRQVQAVVGYLFAVPPLGVLHAAVDAPVFGGVGGHLLQAQQDLLAVRDDLAQLEDLFVAGHLRHISFLPFLPASWPRPADLYTISL